MKYIKKEGSKAIKPAAGVVWKVIMGVLIVIALIIVRVRVGSFDQLAKENSLVPSARPAAQNAVQPGKHQSGKLTLSTTPSSSISVDSDAGEKIEFGPTKWVVYKALANDGESVLTFVPRGANTTDGRQVKDLRNVRFVLAQPSSDPVELVYFKYKGELPANWWDIAVKETR